MKSVALCLVLSVITVSAIDIELPELQVHPDKPEVSPGAQSEKDFFRKVGLLLRKQGAQADLGYRGSSFSGTGIAIAGMALRHPQTEHFHAELPFPFWIFAHHGMTSGAEDVLQGQGHAAATLHLGFPAIERSRLILNAGVGEKNWHWSDAGAVKAVEGETAAGGAAVFAGHERRDRIDYSDNNLERIYGGGWVQRRTESARSDLAVGISDKRFGARGYYGVNPEWGARERLEDRLLLMGHTEHMAQSTARFSALARETVDNYRLDFGTPDIYENHHRTRIAGGMAALDTRLSSVWSLHMRGSAENEELNSNRLGVHERTRAAVLLAPVWNHGEIFSVTAGGEYSAFSSESSVLLPLFRTIFNICANTALFAGYSQRERQPSFTELNYESPGSLGNEGLDREKITTIDGGIQRILPRGVMTRLTVFQRTTRNTVDWIKQTVDEPRWLATDVGKVTTRGAELRGTGQWRDKVRLLFQYTLLDRDYDLNPHAARYVLDYPRHQLLTGMDWHICRTVTLSVVNTLQVRDKIESRQERTGIDGTLRMEWSPVRTTGLRIALLCDNLWDDDFAEYVGQPAAGRRWGIELRTEL